MLKLPTLAIDTPGPLPRTYQAGMQHSWFACIWSKLSPLLHLKESLPAGSKTSTSSDFLLISTRITNLEKVTVPLLLGSADLIKFSTLFSTMNFSVKVSSSFGKAEVEIVPFKNIFCDTSSNQINYFVWLELRGVNQPEVRVSGRYTTISIWQPTTRSLLDVYIRPDPSAFTYYNRNVNKANKDKTIAYFKLVQQLERLRESTVKISLQ